MATPSTRTEKLDLRLTAAAKQALHAAAAATRRSVSEFVLDSALARAMAMLLCCLEPQHNCQTMS